MFWPYTLVTFKLWFNLQSSYTRCVGCSFRVLGVGWEERDLVVSIVGTMTQGCYKWIIISCLCTYGQHIGPKHVVVNLLYYQVKYSYVCMCNTQKFFIPQIVTYHTSHFIFSAHMLCSFYNWCAGLLVWSSSWMSIMLYSWHTYWFFCVVVFF